MGRALISLKDYLSTAISEPLPPAAVSRYSHECDVLVVGFGLAGASAALAAAERGLEVLLIDRFAGGGSSELSGGIVYAGGGTPTQQECHVEDSPEAMAQYLVRETGGIVSEAAVRQFCADSVDTLSFLSRHGVQFSGPKAPKKTSYPSAEYYLYYSDNSTIPLYRGAGTPAERGHRVKDPRLVPGAPVPPGQKPHGGFSEGADMGWHLMAAMKLAVSKQPRIRVLEQTRAIRLIADNDRVVGAMVSRLRPGTMSRAHARLEKKAKDLTLQLTGLSRPLQYLMKWIEQLAAQPASISAKRGVILAAGGYMRNSAMIRQYAARYLKSFPIGSLGDDGAGIRLGVSVGGVADHLDKVSAWRFINPPFDWTQGVIIGHRGTRIVNEEMYGAHLSRAIYEVSDGRAWLILDHALWQKALDSLESSNLYAFQQFPVMQARKAAVQAPSIGELARKLGVCAPAMETTIERYSTAYRNGAADEFGKSDACRSAFGGGPFYAIDLAHRTPTNPITSLSTGGLRVDEGTGAVLREGDTPVAGLYAAGRNAVGLPSNNYVSGLSLADCVWSGRRAANAIAQS